MVEQLILKPVFVWNGGVLGLGLVYCATVPAVVTTFVTRPVSNAECGDGGGGGGVCNKAVH